MARFEGSTSQCILDYGQRYNIGGGLGLLAEFTGVVPATALDWVQGGALPKGSTLLKLRCYLHLVGYRVEEFVSLPKPTRHFAQILAFEFLTLEEAAELLQYRNVQELYSIVLRGTEPLPDKAHRLQRVVGDYDAQREVRVAEIKVKLASLISVRDEAEAEVEHSQVEVVPFTQVAPPPVPPLESALAVTLLIHNIKAAIQLVDHLHDTEHPEWSDMAREVIGVEVTDGELAILVNWIQR